MSDSSERSSWLWAKRVDASGILSFVLRLMIAVATALVIPLWLATLKDRSNQQVFDTQAQVIVSCLTFLIVAVVGLTLSVIRNEARSTRDAVMWEVRSQFDETLANIRKAHQDILRTQRTDGDMFAPYFARSLRLFCDTIHEAATKEDLHVNELHVPTSELLVACFDGRDEDIVRLTHYVDDNDFMFDVWSRENFRRMHTLVKSGKIRAIRRLFIYRNADSLNEPRTQQLLDFHATNPHYELRLISHEDWTKFVFDARIREPLEDFGIYGHWYVYRTISASAERIEGVFSRSKNKTEQFIELFDNAWKSCGHRPMPEESHPMSLSELFGIDVGEAVELERPQDLDPPRGRRLALAASRGRYAAKRLVRALGFSGTDHD